MSVQAPTIEPGLDSPGGGAALARPLGVALPVDVAPGSALPLRSMPVRRLLLLIVGLLSLAFGVVGVILPVLPTTPFVLLAAGCFARSSPRLQVMLERSRLFGPFIEHYRCHTGITVLRKVVTLAILWAGLGISMFFVPLAWLVPLLAMVGVCVTTHILLLRTRQ